MKWQVAALALAMGIGAAKTARSQAKGTLQITADRECDVYVDGRYVGLTPVKAHGVAAGRHRVELRTRKGRSHYRTITLRAGVTLRIAHRFGPPPIGGHGFLDITSRPWSQVFIDSRAVGNTPLSRVRLTTGSHRLELRTVDGRKYRRRIFVERGKSGRVVYRFPARPRRNRPVGWIKVNSAPAADVYLDGKKIGRTPLADHPLTPGRHWLRLRTKDGRNHRKSLLIGRGRTSHYNYRFGRTPARRSRVGHLTVRANLPATVYVDGKSYGPAPLVRHGLRAGKHWIIVRASKGRRRTFPVWIPAGGTRIMTVRFRRK